MLTTGHALAQSCISLTATAYSQNFNSLASTGSAADTTLPAGWYLLEGGTGANSNYSAGTGSSSAGDIYSFGLAGSNERSLGSVRSGAVVPTFGACVTNNTGGAIGAVRIEYVGRQWRLGTAGRTDALVFSTSTDATSLASGTWNPTPASSLDFVTPTTTVVGAKDGTFSGNYRFFGETVPLPLAAGATAWIRWTDTDASGADDGLAIDNFSIVPDYGPVTPALSIDDVTQAEGSTGPGSFLFRLTLTAPAPVGGVSYDITTANGTATDGDDYAPISIVTARIGQGSTTGIFSVQVDGDTAPEADETFFVNISNVAGATLADGQGKGTIQNDDFAIVPIHAIQGSGPTSPYVGSVVATEGIVTGVTSTGFFLQTLDAKADLDPATSEGIFVYTASAPPAIAARGNLVIVNGTVDEYQPAGQLPLTEIRNATVLQGSGNAAQPMSIMITDADASATSAIDRLERYEAMYVTIPSLKVVAPSGGTINEVAATSTSDGTFYGVIPSVGRPLREPGLDVLSPVTPPAGVFPPVFDHNPELIRVRSTGQPGAALISVDAGDLVNGLSGVLDYGSGAYTLLPDPFASVNPPVLGSMMSSVPQPGADELTIGGFNLLRFFDDVADGNGAPTLTPSAYQNRLRKTGNAICAFTGNPDILGVVEVENLKALGDLATSINTRQGNVLFPGSCTDNPAYQAYLVDGNDVGGIDVGFLVKTAEVSPGKPRIEVVSATQVGKEALFTNADNSTELLNDRPPYVLVARVNFATGNSQTITVIANHLRSLIDVDSTAVGTKGWPTVGARVRAKRGEQARFLAQLVQDRQAANPAEKIVLLGDFNAFEFSDGLVDSMGIITGREAGPTQVVHYVDSPITTPLTNQLPLVFLDQRYSFLFDGNAQALDHMIVNQAVLEGFSGVRTYQARVNADFGVDNFGDYTVPVRVSDHDPIVLYLRERLVGAVDLGVTMFAPAEYSPTQGLTFYLYFGNNGPQAATNVKLDLASTLPPGSLTVTPAQDLTCSPPEPDAGDQSLVHCSMASLAANSGTQFTVVVDPDAPGADDASATLAAAISSNESEAAPANNSASATSVRTDLNLCFLVQGQCGFEYVTIPKAPRSEIVHVVFTYANLGGTTKDDVGILVSVPLPLAQVQLPSHPECTKFSSPSGTEVFCNLGKLATGSPAGTLALDLDLSSVTTKYLDFGARMSSGPSYYTGFHGLIEVVPHADLGLAMTAVAKPGDYRLPVEFRGKTSNDGPDSVPTEVRLRYTAPGATVLPVASGDWRCQFLDENPSPVAGEVYCLYFQFAPGESHDVTLTFQPVFAQSGGNIRVEASIAAGYYVPAGTEAPVNVDPLGNNSATVDFAVPSARSAAPLAPPSL